jgi:cytidylate kinase
MSVITISRELGSFGTHIAELAAARLGVACVDKEVLAEMARQAGVPVNVIVEAEERLMSRPMVVSEEMRSLFASRARQQSSGFDEASYVKQMREAIRELAQEGNVVFVGRGTQVILAEDEHALHVHLYAPLEVRAARIQERRKLPNLETAVRVVRQADEHRRDWFRRFFTGVNWQDPRHYHLMINTGRIGDDLAAELIARAAHG